MDGHSIGDGIIVVALAAAFVGYHYLKSVDRRRRLEIVHQERLAAMDKGIPLPELPLEPPAGAVSSPPDPGAPLFIGTILVSLGGGTMLAFWLAFPEKSLWPLPLPIAMMGLGFLLFYALPRPAVGARSASRGD